MTINQKRTPATNPIGEKIATNPYQEKPASINFKTIAANDATKAPTKPKLQKRCMLWRDSSKYSGRPTRTVAPNATPKNGSVQLKFTSHDPDITFDVTQIDVGMINTANIGATMKAMATLSLLLCRTLNSLCPQSTTGRFAPWGNEIEALPAHGCHTRHSFARISLGVYLLLEKYPRVFKSLR